MALEPGIILGGQGVNALGAIAAGNQAAAQQQEFMRQRDYNAMLQKNGAGIVGGNQTALNALAAFDPTAAIGVQQGQLAMQGQKQNMAFQAEEMAMKREQSKLQAQQWLAEQSASVTAEQLKAEAEQIEGALSGAAFFYQNKDQAGYNAFLQSKGINPAEYPFEQFPAHAAEFGGVLDAMKAFQPAGPLSTEGKVAADISSGFLPQNTPLSSPGVVVNTGDNAPDDGKLRGKLMEKEGELWSSYLQTGAISAGTVQDMSALDELITIAPQGPVTGRLAEIFPGFSTAGDAFTSIVKRVAPTLRAPGSGATSDIEYDGMLRSLPALRNTPEANRAIAGMMKAKAAINVERAKIITAYQNGQIDAKTARDQMNELDKRSIMTPEAASALGLSGGDNSAPAASSGKSPDQMSDEELLNLYGAD